MEKKNYSAFSQTTAKITVDFSSKRLYLNTDIVAKISRKQQHLRFFFIHKLFHDDTKLPR